IQALRDRDVAVAAAWRTATRAVLHPALAAGWEATELVRAAEGSYYVLTPPAGARAPSPTQAPSSASQTPSRTGSP
ncbi:MAG: hypothetical protein RQ751_12940, partial [Longimicrobiales bacterium]|nr:hypothetical protein [Longimicrobiales bacterium]